MIVRHDRADAAYRRPAAAHPAVGCLEAPGRAKGIGSLIHPRWVLTAAHSAIGIPPGHEVRFGETQIRVRRTVLHPSWDRRPARPSRSSLAGFADLALLELDAPAAGIESLGLYAGSDEAGAVVTLVGNGGTGTGLTGARNWDGVWRAATNRVEEVLHEDWLLLRFDEPERATPLEGVNGIGDSGCPALLRHGGRWLVAGTASWEDASEARLRGGYGAWKYFVRVAAHLPWIQEELRGNGDSLQAKHHPW